MYGNEYRRFRLNNLVIGNIGAVANLAVDVAVTSGKVKTGDVGFAIAVDANMTDGIPGIIPVVATSNTNIRLLFTNASAGAIDPADTFDFNVVMFPQTGNLAQTV